MTLSVLIREIKMKKITYMLLLCATITACTTDGFTVEEYAAYMCGGDNKLANVQVDQNNVLSFGSLKTQTITAHCKNRTQHTARVTVRGGQIIEVNSTAGQLPSYD